MNPAEYADATKFRARVWTLLIEREAENNLMVGIVGQLAAGAGSESVGATGKPRYWSVQNGGDVIAAAVVTPPHRLLLTQMAPGVVGVVVAELCRQGVSLPGVVAPKETAEEFAAGWCPRNGRVSRLGHAMRIYQIDRVVPPASVPGRMETARSCDFDMVREWNAAFSADVGAHVPVTPERVRRRIQNGEVFLWRAADPVSMGVVTGPTPHRRQPVMLPLGQVAIGWPGGVRRRRFPRVPYGTRTRERRVL